MFFICAVLLVFSSVSTAVGARTVTGHRGDRLDIRCPYEAGYESNTKYLCKGECNYLFRKIMVESGSPAKDERFSLNDDTRNGVFTVTITDLRPEDTGRYWCGVSGVIFDVYSEILLQVKQDPKTTEASTLSSFSVTPSYFSTAELNPQSTNIAITDQHTSGLSPVAGGLGSVLLALLLSAVMFLVLKKRKRKSGTALFQQNTESVHVYEIADRDPGPSDVIDTSSSNQMPASHLDTRSHVSTVYVAVTNQQPDPNPSHTSSTNEVPDTDWDYYTNMSSPVASADRGTDVIYSTVTQPQNIKTNHEPIYSDIKHQ